MSTIPRPSLNSPMPPWINDPSGRWVTIKEFAELYRRTERRIQQMLRNGDIMDFGVTTYQDAKGKWWLRLPS